MWRCKFVCFVVFAFRVLHVDHLSEDFVKQEFNGSCFFFFLILQAPNTGGGGFHPESKVHSPNECVFSTRLCPTVEKLSSQVHYEHDNSACLQNVSIRVLIMRLLLSKLLLLLIWALSTTYLFLSAHFHCSPQHQPNRHCRSFFFSEPSESVSTKLS